MKIRLFILVALCAGVALALGSSQARAVVTVPIPADVAPAPPPIPALPAAGETPPPAEAITDPIEPGAACGDWYQQSNYGDMWPGSSTWWEYQCTYEYPQCVGMCNADWGPYHWIDSFFWDGSNAVFYGEFFWDSYFGGMYVASGCSYWWDAPTSQWYLIQCPVEEPVNSAPTASVASSCSGLSCTFDGSGSSDNDGTIVNYEWVFGDGRAASGGPTFQHTYTQSGIYTVTLKVTDDGGAVGSESTAVTVDDPNTAPSAAFTFNCSGLSCAFDGSSSSDRDGTIVAYQWGLGDGMMGSGATVQHTYAQPGTHTVTLTVTDNGGDSASASKDVTVTNTAPSASFTVRCSGLGCSFDAGASSDGDGTITGYSWDFGNGSGGSGKLAEHTYAQPGAYTVTLTVTDNGGATATSSKAFNPISLSARGYKLNGLQKVDLSWSGPSGTGFDLYRNGTKIVTVQATAYTDNVNKKGTGSYVYKLCAVASSVCSNETTVTF